MSNRLRYPVLRTGGETSVCCGYYRKGYCTFHRIHEEVLDAAVQEYAETMREQCAEELKKLVQMQKMWALRKLILNAHIASMQKRAQYVLCSFLQWVQSATIKAL